jgi:hypothetical protein
MKDIMKAMKKYPNVWFTITIFGYLFFMTIFAILLSTGGNKSELIHYSVMPILALSVTYINYKNGFLSEVNINRKVALIIFHTSLIILPIMSVIVGDSPFIFIIQYVCFFLILIVYGNYVVKGRKTIEKDICNKLHVDSLRDINLSQYESVIDKDLYNSDRQYKNNIDGIRNLKVGNPFSLKYWDEHGPLHYFVLGLVFWGLAAWNFVEYFYIQEHIDVLTVIYLVAGFLLIYKYSRVAKNKLLNENVEPEDRVTARTS